MKISNFKYLLILFASFVLITGCNDDEEPEISPYVGNYVISHAEVSEVFNLMTDQGLSIPVPMGTDITTSVQAALLSAVNCSSPDKTYIELREDKSIYMSCEGQNELNAGTWEEVSETILKLNMNSAAIPSSPTGFVLTVTNIVMNSAGLSGTTSVPMPKEMFAAGLAALGMTIADNPPVYTVTFSIDLMKK